MAGGGTGGDALAAAKAALISCSEEEYRAALEEIRDERYARTGVASPAAYSWTELGTFIEEENPYLPIGTGSIAIDLRATARRGGLLAEFSAKSGLVYTFNPATVISPAPSTEAEWDAAVRAGYTLPKPTAPGSKTWFHKIGKKPKDTPELPGTHLPDTRQVVKTIELEYQPKVDGGTGPKPPHIVILFCGGNSA